jgi:hypothetical protein
MVSLEWLEPIDARTKNMLFLAQNLARDHQALDFAGALANRAQFHVAIKLFRRIIFDEAVAAVNLHGFVRDAHGHFS